MSWDCTTYTVLFVIRLVCYIIHKSQWIAEGEPATPYLQTVLDGIKYQDKANCRCHQQSQYTGTHQVRVYFKTTYTTLY